MCSVLLVHIILLPVLDRVVLVSPVFTVPTLECLRSWTVLATLTVRLTRSIRSRVGLNSIVRLIQVDQSFARQETTAKRVRRSNVPPVLTVRKARPTRQSVPPDITVLSVRESQRPVHQEHTVSNKASRAKTNVPNVLLATLVPLAR